VRNGSAPARGMLPRVLALLSFRDRDPGAPPGTLGPVAAALRKAGRAVPLWAWLPWLPQLQAALLRPESGVAREILMRLASAYPQPLHIVLRTALISLRDGAVKAVHEARAAAGARDGAPRPAPAPAADASAPAAPTPAAPGAPAAAPPPGAPVAAGAAPAVDAAAPTAGGAAPAPAQAPATSGGSAGTGGAGAGAPPARARPAGSGEAMEKPPELLAFEAGKEIMEFIRSKHTHIAGLLDLLLNDLGAQHAGVSCRRAGRAVLASAPAPCLVATERAGRPDGGESARACGDRAKRAWPRRVALCGARGGAAARGGARAAAPLLQDALLQQRGGPPVAAQGARRCGRGRQLPARLRWSLLPAGPSRAVQPPHGAGVPAAPAQRSPRPLSPCSASSFSA